MVGELYDYMVGIVIVGILFISAVSAVPTISYVNLFQVNQQQLRNTALNVFNAMLLGTGYPSDWGSTFPFNQSNVEAFGLASSGESSLYVLDSDKVQRLDKDSPGYIEYSYVRDLLRLEDYGFRLSIFRPFTVDWDLQINNVTNSVWFAINVTRSEDQRPIPNAQVSVTVLATAINKNTKTDPVAIVNVARIFFTNALGRCEGNEPVTLPSDDYYLGQAIAVMKVTVSGISTMVVAHAGVNLQDVMRIDTFGDTLTLSYRGWTQELPEGARRIKQIDVYNYDQLIRVWSGSDDPSKNKINQGSGDFQYWNMTFPGLRMMEPALLLFTVLVTLKGLGPTLVIIAGPFSLGESSEIFSFGSDSEHYDVATKLRRYVVFAGMTYIAELTLWRE